ncbi:peptide-methionine (S)-S-oxide reductase MsrA [Candidatus Laterigemmans baculatus]|uniref:peptide-methionine (S)-S-oxide reductase MsrA n=1 Tax=Candidatus Laterigemmans baculatus TaxID=2770505 RepID=UPI0013D97220|nr:peptide-methionine (S)-S-oxide reductase MsrA [Candidatus Laterigemmans baculatus]
MEKVNRRLFTALLAGSLGGYWILGGTLAAAAGAETKKSATQQDGKKMAVATFGGGCFWCVEAVFEPVAGVTDVVSGYEGGHVENPTYEQVCGKRTGHVEVCQIHFDPSVVSYEELLKIFFKTHDPTSKNRQGADEGPQYRSVIFYHDETQKQQAEAFIKKLDDSGEFGRRRVVTDVEPTKVFYQAEEYHQDYYAKNPFAGYCQAVVRPKVEKVKEVFGDKLK